MNDTKYNVLLNEISNLANRTSSRSKENKLKSFGIYIAIAISSALITILVAISGDVAVEYQFLVKILTLFLSGLTTIMAAWDGFYNHKQLWVHYGETRNHLRSLELRMHMLDDKEKQDMEILDSIFQEFQEVLQHGNSNWKALRMEKVENKSLNE